MKRFSLVLVLAAICAALAVAGCAKKEASNTAAQGAPGDAGGMLKADGPAGAPEGDAGATGGAMGGGMPPGGMPPMGTPTIETGEASGPSAAAGLKWSVPAKWAVDTERPMRVATYGVPAASGDAEGGECGVFYFGATQGGDIESNIARWVGQFENAGTPQRSTRTVNGVNVSLVSVTGSYLAPSGPMMQSSGTKPGYALLGAIAEGPQGRVFFKLTGPKKTLDACKADFDAMLASIQKE
jgi:hypothetical protein